MGKYVLDSSEYINENVYCKLKTEKWYTLDRLFDLFVERVTGYNDTMDSLKGRFSRWSFDYEYRKTFKKDFDLYSFYGIKKDFVKTDKGDKFVLQLDSRHSFVLYPMCDETKDANAPRYDSETKTVTDPKYGVLSVYAVTDGKGTKFKDEYNHYFVADNNFKEDGSETKKLLKSMMECAAAWGVRKEYGKRNEELKSIADKLEEAETERKKAEAAEKERIAAERKMRETVEKRGAVMTVYYKGRPISEKTVLRGIDSVSNIRYVFTMNAKLSIEEAVGNGVHPDTSGMTNLDNPKPRKGVYTKRNLPIDHYTLEDYYRTYPGEICQHCDKNPIINVMVIKNPKGETFHVGNECVSHLVDIPQEEFEENWNAPFKAASNIMAKMRADKAKGLDGTWYTYKGEKRNRCFYVTSAKPLSDYDFFSNLHSNEKVLKRELSLREVDEDFMKRMLPRNYADSIEVPVNIADIVDMIYEQRHLNFSNFIYDGVRYDIPNTKNPKIDSKRRRYFVEETDYSKGEYSQKFEDAGYGLKNATYTFGNVTIEYKWKTESDEN